jgi:hypothetical protein
VTACVWLCARADVVTGRCLRFRSARCESVNGYLLPGPSPTIPPLNNPTLEGRRLKLVETPTPKLGTPKVRWLTTSERAHRPARPGGACASPRRAAATPGDTRSNTRRPPTVVGRVRRAPRSAARLRIPPRLARPAGVGLPSPACRPTACGGPPHSAPPSRSAHSPRASSAACGAPAPHAQRAGRRQHPRQRRSGGGGRVSTPKRRELGPGVPAQFRCAVPSITIEFPTTFHQPIVGAGVRVERRREAVDPVAPAERS